MATNEIGRLSGLARPVGPLMSDTGEQSGNAARPKVGDRATAF
jgi:hypothetical protein